MRAATVLKEFRRKRAYVPELGERHTICNWVRDEEAVGPFVEHIRYGELLSLLPDHVVTNMEKSRLAQDGQLPMIMNGLGYQELVSAIIVDGTAITSSSSEARLAPAVLVPANYMQPGGIPGRNIRVLARGRGSTLVTTAGTMTFRHRIAATDVITGTVMCATGAMAADAAAQTATMWQWDADVTTRSVGSAGTVYAMGKAELAWHSAFTAANNALRFAGSAGSATPAAATWDMTAAQYFQFTGQWSVTTAYSIQCHQYTLEAMN